MYDRAAKVQMCSKSNKFQESFLNSSFTFFFSFFFAFSPFCLSVYFNEANGCTSSTVVSVKTSSYKSWTAHDLGLNIFSVICFTVPVIRQQ